METGLIVALALTIPFTLIGLSTIGFIVARLIYLKWFYEPGDLQIEISALEKQNVYLKAALEKKDARLDELMLLVIENQSTE